jgi:hypothetical protein
MLFVILNIFTIISSLLVVTEITLFFKTDQLQSSIALTLTVMLVMYTMYQSIIETMTRTAYLKLIDYWLLFCLLVPFLTFMIEVYWYLSPTDSVVTIRRKKVFQKYLDRMVKQSFIKIFVPSVTFVFISIYCLVAIMVTAISA